MNRILRLLAPALLLAAGLARPARAQTPIPLLLEFRGGAGSPVGDFNHGSSNGWIVGGTVRYHTSPTADVYGGFDYASFPPDDPEAGVDIAIRDYGLRFGMRADLPHAGTAALTPWVEGGLLLNRTSVKASDGVNSATVNSDWGLGAELGAGFSIPIGPGAALTPGIRYRTYKADFGSEIGRTNVGYFAVDLGVVLRS